MGFTPPLPVESRPELLAWGDALARERGLLGAVLCDPSLYAQVRRLVAAEDFSTAIHERLFDAFDRFAAHDWTVDRDGVAAELGVYAWDAEDGVPAYLDRLIAVRAMPAEVAHHAREIHALAEARRVAPEPIEVDTVTWSHHQATLLARLAERSDEVSRAVDWQSVIEEILYVGRSQTGGVARKIELVFEHLLKLLSDPDAPSRNRWRIEIDAWQERIVHESSPSMRQLIDLDAAWRRGRSAAAIDLAEYGVRLPRDLPETCPFTFDELTAGTLTLAGLLEKLAASGDIKPS